jgi:hypothetical protein
VDKSWQESKEILVLIVLDEYKHSSICAEALHFLRYLTVIEVASEKSISKEGCPFPLKGAEFCASH